MEATELMIGNYIYGANPKDAIVLPITSIFTRVDAILPFGDLLLNLNPMYATWECPAKLCTPIPLTPDILDACGFVKDGPNHVKINDQIGFYTGELGKYLLQLNNTHDEFHMGIDIELFHLHQLQNWVYIFTGQPLQIDLKKLV